MDLFWIGFTLVLVVATFGLIAVCDRTRGNS